MRFAWLRKKTANGKAATPNIVERFTLTIYNLVWWLPIVLTVIKTIDYGTGFITFAAITAIRLSANLYRNNFLSLEQAERFPFRSP